MPQQRKQSKRQVDDDQVNNDTSRAPEPDNLTGAQAEVDSKPGATKTEAAGTDAGGQARAERRAPEQSGQAPESPQTATADGGTAASAEAAPDTPEPAEATSTQPSAGSEDASGDGQPATPADVAADAGGKPATERVDEADASAVEAEPQAAQAEEEQAEADGGRAAPAEEAEEPAEAERSAEAAEEEASEAVLAELVSARAEAEGYLDDLRRLQAEFDNYRKRIMRDQSARIASASQALVSRLLPVLDNFELAVSHAEQSRDFDRMLKGVEMVFGELNEVLTGEGLVAIEASGKPFDPERHEAVAAVEEDGVEAGTVVDVVRKGYEFNGRVLRPAMVKVAR
jgi:molecular chaperone GrpE